jgi:hypothetical protein
MSEVRAAVSVGLLATLSHDDQKLASAAERPLGPGSEKPLWISERICWLWVRLDVAAWSAWLRASRKRSPIRSMPVTWTPCPTFDVPDHQPGSTEPPSGWRSTRWRV